MRLEELEYFQSSAAAASLSSCYLVIEQISFPLQDLGVPLPSSVTMVHIFETSVVLILSHHLYPDPESRDTTRWNYVVDSDVRV